MKHKKIYLCISCILIIAIAMTGCGDSGNADSASGDFSYSDGIDNDGYWEDITAKDYITMADYKGINIPEENHTVTEGAIEAEIDSILSQNTTTNEIKDRAVKDGETVNIDYVGTVDGEEFDGGSTEGAGTEITLGEAGYVDDFEDQIVGHTPGDTFDVKVTFPDDYSSEDLQGKDAVFETTLNFISEKVTPELTDEFVEENLKESNGWTTVDEMEKGIKQNLEDSNIRTYINQYLSENFTASSVPESILEYQDNSMIAYYESMASSYSMEVDEMLSSMGVESMDELVENEAETNKANAELSLIIQAIAEDLELKVTEEDLETYFSENMGSADYSSYEETYGLPYLKQSVINEEVIDFIKENSKLL